MVTPSVFRYPRLIFDQSVRLVLSRLNLSARPSVSRSETRPAISPTVVQNGCPGGEHPRAEGGSFRRNTGWTLIWSSWLFLNGPIMLHPACRQRRTGTS